MSDDRPDSYGGATSGIRSFHGGCVPDRFDVLNCSGNFEHYDLCRGCGCRFWLRLHGDEKMNPYQTLQVAETASPDVIRAAWAALVRECHPDSKTPNAARTRSLNEAWALLKDPEKRKQTDENLKLMREAAKPPKVPKMRPGAKSHNVPDISTMAAYPPAYPGFTDSEIDNAVNEMTKQMPPLLKTLVRAGIRTARGRA
jgi:hypothetical protein